MAKYVINSVKILANKIFNVCEETAYQIFKDVDKSKKTKILYLEDDDAYEMMGMKKSKDFKIVKVCSIMDDDMTSSNEDDDEDFDDDLIFRSAIVLCNFKKQKQTRVVICLSPEDDEFIEVTLDYSNEYISVSTGVASVEEEREELSAEVQDIFNKIKDAVQAFLDDCEVE